MFEQSTNTPAQPANPTGSGPTPGPTLPPLGSSFGTPPPPAPPRAGISPEGMSKLPPIIASASAPKKPKGGRGKRTMLIIIIVAVLLAGGAAVAALLFPPQTGNSNITNLVTNANTNQANANTNVNRNTNTANTNSIAENANTNTNAANTNTANINSASNGNVNDASNANTNTSSNTNSSRPAGYDQDSDGDALNNYLEDWISSNKNNADSDADGFPDGSEVVNGYSPLGGAVFTAQGFQAFCANSVLIAQYKLGATDTTTFCGIGGNILTSIQVMTSNKDFFDDLDAMLATTCGAFGKIDLASCTDLTKHMLVSYLIST